MADNHVGIRGCTKLGLTSCPNYDMPQFVDAIVAQLN